MCAETNAGASLTQKPHGTQLFDVSPLTLPNAGVRSVGLWGRLVAWGRAFQAKKRAKVFAQECASQGKHRRMQAGSGCAADGASSRAASWVQILHDPMVDCQGRGFVLADPVGSRPLAHDLSAIGFDVDMCCDYDSVMGVLQCEAQARHADPRWSVLLIDLDYLTQDILLEEIVDDLLSLRQSMETLNVIILSSEAFGRDSSSTSRLAITDASLRLPVGVERLRDAVQSARSSNALWQDRLQTNEGQNRARSSFMSGGQF